MPNEFKVGLLHFASAPGREVEEKLNSLLPFKNVRGEETKILAEHIMIHEISVDYQTHYKMIIDRSSHRLSQAVGILKIFAFRGISIVNNPLSFWWFINSKDAGYGMMRDIGVLVPKTYLLPQHITPYLDVEEFQYHRFFNWKKMMSEVTFPCYIKPSDGRGAIDCNRAENMEELLHYYNRSGSKVMTVQQAVSTPYDWHVRCLCVGRHIIPMKFIFRKHDMSEYIQDHDFLAPETEELIIQQARVINRAFGYEMNSVEFIIDYDGLPWAIDFNNPVPDGRREKLGEYYFSAYVKSLVSLAVDKAYIDQPTPFLPDLNSYSMISQKEVSLKEKFNKALKLANEYYEPTNKPPDIDELY